MGSYRLHYLDGSTADIVHVREFEAESDETAIAYAEEVRSLTSMELWAGPRKLKTWAAFPPMTSQ